MIGIGKSMIVKCLANESQRNLIIIKPSQVKSKWLGNSEQAIQKIMDFANQNTPCILFFDEVPYCTVS